MLNIRDNEEDFQKALEIAHKEFPPEKMKYIVKPDEFCSHHFSFCIYCDGGKWDIVRCTRCGEERVKRCTFDEEYD